ncbi:MAG: hypothetical protein AAB602_00955 [Patescibacteria group bacterium]
MKKIAEINFINTASPKFIKCWVLSFVIFALALNFVSTTLAVDINVNLPGTSADGATDVKEKGPIFFVEQFYKFGLMIGGLLAFGAIVYGGIKYTFAAGNPSGQSEGKEWVKSAILGLLLLALATLILKIINPSLTTPELPNF